MKVSILWIGLVLFMFLWAITGGLWERKAPTLNFRALARERLERVRGAQLTNAPPETPYIANQPGLAESVRNFLFGGTAIPGWSRAPKVDQSEHEQRIMAQREAEKGLRLKMQQQAVRDLARRLGGVPVEDISLASWSEQVWMFGEVGCVQPGEVTYASNNPGWMFVLSYSEQPHLLYVYNATRDGKVLKFCRTESKSTESL